MHILSWLFVMFFTLPVHAQIFVGNGGEGITANSTVYDRDLYDYDLQLNPWFGNKPDPLLQSLIREWNPLQLSSAECNLLAQKLSDLNASQLNLGDELYAALSFFNWKLTDQDLTLINPDEVRRPIDNKLRVPIANRLLQSILVNGKNFNLLDSKNKVALILHEAVYALTNVNPWFSLSMPQSQSLSATRQIVAGFFDQQQISSTGFSILLQSSLAIHRDDLGNGLRPFLKNLPPSFMVSLFVNDSVDEVLTSAPILLSANPAEAALFAKKLCAVVQPDDLVTQIILQKNDVRNLKQLSYQNNDGVEQYALQIDYEVGTYVSFRTVLAGAKACQDFLATQISREAKN